jgi:ribosome biogenesis protein YTM1
MSSSDEMFIEGETITDDNKNKQSTKIRVAFHLSPSIRNNRSQLEVPTEPMAVPSNIRKRGLSAIVNHLLDRGNKDDSDSDASDGSSGDDDKLPAISFDFLLNDKLLRLPLDSAARNMGLSTEHALELYYFPARLPPKREGESEILPDWIMVMDYCGDDSNNGLLFTGGADGVIRTFEEHKKKKGGGDGGELKNGCSISAHTGPIKCMSSSSFHQGGGSNNTYIATGSMDQTLLTHVYDSKRDVLNLHAVYSGGHGNSISSVVLAASGGGDGKQIMASGDWDGGLAIWNVPTGNDNDVSGAAAGGGGNSKSSKKRKDNNSNSTSANNEGGGTAIQEVQPIHSARAHSSNISGLAWGYNNGGDGSSSSLPTTLLTGSWDHGLKVYDTTRMDCILALNGSRVVTSLSRCSNSDVVATGSPDCTVRLWDMRTNGDGSSGSQLADKTLRQRYVSTKATP